MKRKVFAFALLFVICISLLAGSAQLARDSAIMGELVRLHVIAASNQDEDQRVKLLVRDAILQQVNGMQMQNTEEAVQILRASLPELAEAAQQTLIHQGHNQRVEVTLCTEAYPVRSYGTFSLPAGEYVSLQVRIDEAEGKNWWCVVYPGLCHADDAGAFFKAAEAAGFSDGQVRLMTLEGTQVQFRFKLLELLQKIKNFF